MLEVKDKVLKIICADDTYYNLETLRCVFENLDLLPNCTFVTNGKEAVQAAIKHVEDSDFELSYELVQIVIVDYEMPYLTGLEAIGEITSSYKSKNWQGTDDIRLPTFCMFSVHQFQKFQAYALERGVDQFISKPPNKEEILKIVQRAFSGASN